MADLLPAVRAALAAASTKPEDAGARALAERYAALLDDAEPSKTLATAIRHVGTFLADNLGDTTPQERQVATAWDAISSALAEHSVVSDLGPKLLATLTALGATLAGRKERGASTSAPGASPLQAARDEVAAARERRIGSAGA